MSAMHMKKSHTWLWESHISPKKSEQLSENLNEMDKQVRVMVQLIKEEEHCDQWDQTLVSHVENVHRMYRDLAERYDDLTATLRKDFSSLVFPSEGSSSPSEHDLELQSPPSLELDSNQKTLATHKIKSNGFDVFAKGSDELLSSSETDSEVDDAKEAANRNGSVISSKFNELEAELASTKKQLHAAQAEIDDLRNSMEERSHSSDSVELDGRHDVFVNELVVNNNEIEYLKGEIASKTREFDAELAVRDFEIKKCKQDLAAASEKFFHDKSLLEVEIGKLQEVILILEGEVGHISQEKLLLESRVEELEEALTHLDSSISEVAELQAEIDSMKVEVEKTSQEKQLLESRITFLEQEHALQLHERIDSLNANLDGAVKEKILLEARVEELEQTNASLRDKLSLMEEQIDRLTAEKTEASLNSEKYISELSQNVAFLNIQLETLASEKEALEKEVSVLTEDVASCNEKIKSMEFKLNELLLERSKLVTDAKTAQEVEIQLNAQVKELQDEIQQQKDVIADSAEGKREAIRQLCYSIEHYRDGYKQLRQLLQDHRRPLVMAS